ncbi:hypothetical protein BX600DRAFT_451350 [Xylariales sp. PMI_506]|nr:hypothetical protein BX600DRAFT_451350 [Xylariales sp. PMI_506]
MPPRLVQKLDRDVYQIVRKLENDQAEKTARTGTHPTFTVAGVYDTIKRSNSSIAREKKKPLEDSIHRVLRFRAAERAEEDGEDEDMDDVSAESPKQKVVEPLFSSLGGKPANPDHHLGF